MNYFVHAALAIAGTVLALFLPRRKHLGVGLAAVPLLLAVAGIALQLRLSPAVAWMALALGLVAGAATLLNRLLPRLLLLVSLVFIPGVLAGLPLARAPGAPHFAKAGVLGSLLIIAVLGTLFVRFGLRFLWALIGGALVTGGLWFERPWVWLAAAALLFLINFFTTRFVEYEDPEWGGVSKLAGGLAGGLALAVLLATLLVPELPAAGAAPPEPCAGPACRLARLAKAEPRGGILWPLPSEAMTWGPSGEPWVSNLDALYLGRPTAWPVKLPGTHPLLGRFSLNGPVQAMRMRKGAGEIASLKTSSLAIVGALRDTLPLIRPGGAEGAVAKSVQAAQRAHGCAGDSFPPIVAGGRHALDFHYMSNDGALAAGDVVVIDIGCYADHYASDFTRTLPVSGTFTPEQRKTYTALYEAQQAAAHACKPGVRFSRGADSLDQVVRKALMARHVPHDFKHGVGHPLGLFVHDTFNWRDDTLKPGMVIMIEPGVYLEKEGIGMRLEDAYLVTETGCELLTEGFPADPDSVEKLMAAARSSAP